MNISMSDIKSNRTLQSVLLLGLVIVLLVALLVNTVSAISNNRSDKSLQQAMLQASQTELTELEQMRSNEKENRQLIEEYRVLLPATIDQENLLSRMDRCAAATNTSVSAVTFGALEQTDDAQRLPFSLTVSGSYDNVMRFIETFSTEEQLILVDAFSATRDEVKNGALTAQVSLSAYFQ